VKKFLALVTLILSFPVNAAQVIFVPSPDTPVYSIVVIDAKKLKATVSSALQAYPGEECIPAADLNAPLNCPGLSIGGANSYDWTTGFPVWTSPTDPKKELRIDGLKTKAFKNFGVCTTAGCTPARPTPISFGFNRLTTEFGMMFKTEFEGVVWFSQLQIFVNDIDLGVYPVSPASSQFIGVIAPEGLQSVRFVPINPGNPEVGAFWGYRLYYK
jgi:hypothetical protein